MMPQPMLDGQVKDFLLRRSGSMRREEDWKVRNTRGEIRLVPVRLITVIMLAKLYQWAVTQPTVMACMIWLAMSMSGVPIGMMKIIIAVHPRVIHKDRVQEVTVFFGAVLGTTILSIPVGFSTYVWPTEITAFPRLPSTSTSSVFVVCQDSLLRSSRLTISHVQHDLTALLIWP